MRFAWLLSFVLAAIYLAFVFVHAPAFPIQDDYHDSLQFILSYIETYGPRAQLDLFLSQHVEHRQVLNQLLYAGYFEVFGELDYRILILIANCYVLGVFILYGRSYNSPVLLLVGALFLFNVAYWNASFWLVAAATNFSLVFFALATLMLLDQPGRTSFFIALLAALACCLAFGNGLAILGFGALQLWLQGHRVTRLAIWLLWSTAIVVIYFQAYQQPELLQAILEHGDQRGVWQLALAEPLKFGQWMLAVIGSGFTFGHGGFRILAGGTLVAMWLFLLVRREDKRQLVTMLFSTFLLATLVLVANKHFALEFADLDLPNRYSFYSIVLGMFLLAAFTRHCQNRDIDLERADHPRKDLASRRA